MMPQPKRKARGPAIAWTEAQIDAQVTPEALQVLADEVVADWRTTAPVAAQGALEAKENTEE